MALVRVVRRLLGHTRFVPTPLYRLLVIGQVLAGVSQLVFGPPASVSENSPAYFDPLFCIASFVAGALTLSGLYLVEESTTNARQLHRSFSLELVGLMLLQTVIAINVVGVIYQLGTPPTAGSTWFQIMFWLWGWFRVRDLLRVIKVLGR